VLAITALQLANVEDWKDLYQAKLCKASGDPTNTSVCTYIYAVGAVSICLTIIIGLLQLVTCNMCGCGKYMDAVFTVLAAAWWLAAGFILAAQAKSANEAQPTIPGQEWRTTIVLLSWITSGLFGVLFLVHLGRIGVSCCRKRRRGHGSEQDLEKAGLAAGRPPSAAVELGKEVANRPYMNKGRFGSAKGRPDQDPQQQSVASTYLQGPNI
jgi:hypothetical protein